MPHFFWPLPTCQALLSALACLYPSISLQPSLEQLPEGGGWQSPLLRESPEPGPAPFPRRGTRSMGAGTQTVLRHGEAGAEPGAARGPSGRLFSHGRCCRHGHHSAAGPQPPVQAACPPPGEPGDCFQGLAEGGRVVDLCGKRLPKSCVARGCVNWEQCDPRGWTRPLPTPWAAPSPS